MKRMLLRCLYYCSILIISLQLGLDTIGHNVTSMDPVINPWYGVILEALTKDMNITVEPEVFPAATDSRFQRALGIRALGFSPIRNSEVLLHENDEYIKELVFVEG